MMLNMCGTVKIEGEVYVEIIIHIAGEQPVKIMNQIVEVITIL